jgi:hypothetical protein
MTHHFISYSSLLLFAVGKDILCGSSSENDGTGGKCGTRSFSLVGLKPEAKFHSRHRVPDATVLLRLEG